MSSPPQTAATTKTRWTCSPDVWYEDGNVILESGGTIFRVFTGILSQNSTVFREMFAFPQPLDAESYQGCPLVHLSDSSNHVKQYLKSIHDISYYDPDTVTDFDVVAAILRLSTKYDSPYLRGRAIKSLLAAFPHTLSSYHLLYNKRTNLDLAGVHRFKITNLARECDLHIILPILLFQCSINRLVYFTTSLANKATFDTLNLHDQMLCLSARSEIRLHHRAVFGFLYTHTPSTCLSVIQCLRVKQKAILQLDNIADKRQILWNPMSRVLFEYIKKPLCTFCITEATEIYKRECILFWNKLPSLFGLGTWDSLEDELQRTI